jgi:uncharacterized repeat protein (TIGR01451 family)
VSAKIFWLWVPRDSLAIGTTNAPNRANISSGGTQLAGVVMNSVTGQTNVETNFTTGTGTNNVYNYQFVRSTAGTFSKDVDALDPYGGSNNPLWTVRNPTVFTAAVDGQYYTANVYLRNSSTEGNLTNVILCDKVDNTRQTYADANSAPLNTLTPGVNLHMLPIGSFLAIIDNDISSNARLTTAEIANAGITYTAQLGVGGLNGVGETWASYSLVEGASSPATNSSDHGLGSCNDTDSPIWFDSVSDLLAYDGADADSDPDYTLQDVTKVRVKINQLPDNFIAILYSRILVRATYAFDTTDVNVNSPLSHSAGDSTLGDYAPNQGWAIYDGRSAFRENQAYLIDRVISPRVSKSSTNYPTLNQLIVAGSTIDYQLRVGAVTNGPATTADLTVTDVLPPGVSYINGSSTFVGTTITPQVFNNDPAPGYTRLVYNLINRPIPYGSNALSISYNQGNINFQASTDITLLDGAAILNSATIDTALNSTADCTYTVGTGFGPTTCIYSNWMLEIDNPPGFRIVKAVDQTLVEPDTAFTYTLQWSSIGTNLSGLRLLDILPYDADTRTPPTDFAGNFAMNGALAPLTYTGATAPTADYYYTRKTDRATIVDNPYDASHDITGLGTNSASQTVWCSQAQFGSGDCPTTFADVTAFYLAQTSDALSGSVYTLTIPMNVANNTVGNLYSNYFSAKAPSLPNTLLSNTVTVRVVLGTISGKVYLEGVASNNGVYNTGEAGIANVPVRIVCTAGPSCTVGETYNTLTNASGDYSFALGATNITDSNGNPVSNFEGVKSGTWQVIEVTQPSQYQDGSESYGSTGGDVSTNEQINAIPLGVGVTSSGNNFGEQPMNSLSGKVYLDNATNNGQYDAGESGIAGVTITITCTAGPACTVGESYSVLTDADGNYSFAPGATNILDSNGDPIANFVGVLSGEWAIAESQPSQYEDGSETAGSAGGDTSTNDTISAVRLAKGDSSSGNNFGELPLNSLSGKVYLDNATNNGQYDAGENGITGVTITITCTAGPACTAGESYSVQTDASGNYSFAPGDTNILDSNGDPIANFNGLHSGTWSVAETQPLGVEDGGETVGSAGGTASVNDTLSGIVLGNGDNATDYNFGEESPSASLSGKVYIENPGTDNGQYDVNEVGVANVLITITCQSGPACIDGTTYQVYTDADGNYSFTPGASNILDENGNPLAVFTGLASGNWRVLETQPLGLLDGQESIGNYGGSNTVNDEISIIPIPTGGNATDYNFGETGYTSLSGKVYLEGAGSNNGVYDSGEQGISGVEITVICQSGPACTPGQGYTLLTDADGNYNFAYGAVGVRAVKTGEEVDFPGLLSGTWQIIETQPTVYEDGEESIGNLGGDKSANDEIRSILLDVSTSGSNYNFGEQELGSLSGKVLWDVDANNSVGASDPVIGNVRVTITCTAGPTCTAGESYSILTDASGNYAFVEGATNILDSNGNPIANFIGLHSGNWSVVESQPAGYQDGTDLAGSAGGDTSVNDTISTVTLGVGEQATDYNFLEKDSGTASLSGRVALDSDGDNLMSAGDAGLAGVKVTITCTATPACTVGESYSVLTDANGNYSFAPGATNILDSNGNPISNFTGLAGGTWSVVESQPVDYTDSVDLVGAVNGVQNGVNDVNDTLGSIVLTPGAVGSNYNYLETTGPTAVSLALTGVQNAQDLWMVLALALVLGGLSLTWVYTRRTIR